MPITAKKINVKEAILYIRFYKKKLTSRLKKTLKHIL